MHTRAVYDVVALLVRLALGFVFMAHGWQKIQVGVTATSENFDRLGVPAPTVSAIFATFAELLGGVALIAGVGLPIAGIVLFLDMMGALIFVHAGNGLFVLDKGVPRDGYELVLVLGLTSLLMGVRGGRLSIDHQYFSRSRSAPDQDDEGEDIVDALKTVAPRNPPGKPKPRRTPSARTKAADKTDSASAGSTGSAPIVTTPTSDKSVAGKSTAAKPGPKPGGQRPGSAQKTEDAGKGAGDGKSADDDAAARRMDEIIDNLSDDETPNNRRRGRRKS